MPPLRNRGSNFGDSEVTSLLVIIDEYRPIGSNEWDLVERLHSANYPSKNRTKDAIKRKFQNLVNFTAPTGDPNIPVNVLRAKAIYEKIKLKADFGEDDNYEEEKDDADSFGTIVDTDDDEGITDRAAANDAIIARAAAAVANYNNIATPTINNRTATPTVAVDVPNVAIATPAVASGVDARGDLAIPATNIRTRRDSFEAPLQRIGSKKQRTNDDDSMDKLMKFMLMQSADESKREERKREAEERRMQEERNIREEERKVREEKEERRMEEERKVREEDRKQREEDRKQREERREEDRKLQMQQQNQQSQMMGLLMMGMLSSNPNKEIQEQQLNVVKNLIQPTPNPSTPTVTTQANFQSVEEQLLNEEESKEEGKQERKE